MLPETRDSFRALGFEAQDRTTESGQRAYAALLGVCQAFAQVSAESERVAEIRVLPALSAALSLCKRL